MGAGCRERCGGAAGSCPNDEAGLVKLQLPDVTLVALDTVCHDLTMLAVKECMDKAQFGAVHVHTNDFGPYQRTEIEGVHFPIQPFPTVDDAMTYLWYGVPQRVETSHFLMVQWDSGIVSPAQWSDDFLGYDYVGAPWGWYGDAHEVGNGGFSLRSRRLMQHVCEQRETFPLGHPGIFNWPRVFSLAALQERTVLTLANKYLSKPQHLAELLYAMKVQLAE